MTLVLLVVLAAAHLEDLDLLVATLGQNRGLDTCTSNQRRADFHGIAFANHQDLVERDFSANVCRYLFYFDFFASGNTILLATGFYDRVHLDSNYKERGKPRIMPRRDNNVKQIIGLA